MQFTLTTLISSLIPPDIIYLVYISNACISYNLTEKFHTFLCYIFAFQNIIVISKQRHTIAYFLAEHFMTVQQNWVQYLWTLYFSRWHINFPKWNTKLFDSMWYIFIYHWKKKEPINIVQLLHANIFQPSPHFCYLIKVLISSWIVWSSFPIIHASALNLDNYWCKFFIFSTFVN